MEGELHHNGMLCHTACTYASLCMKNVGQHCIVLGWEAMERPARQHGNEQGYDGSNFDELATVYRQGSVALVHGHVEVYSEL